MIPDIGIMVGLYIITRMVSTIFDQQQRMAAKILAGVTIVGALVTIADLLTKGTAVVTPHM
jgi:hypothetical protein